MRGDAWLALTSPAWLWFNGGVKPPRVEATAAASVVALSRPALRVGVSVAVAVVLLTCYWLTLAPTITDPDSGELATAVHTMGVAHPTGYPLYLMVGKLFDLLPLGEPARRIAFFSAVSAAAGGGLLCWMLIALTGSGVAGALGGLTLGLNWWVWRLANQVEVYALHMLLVCVVLAMFVRWLEQRTPRRLNQLAFCCGLALTHHRTSAFFIMPVLVWALIATRPVRVLGLAKTVGWGLLPLLLYGWLPYRSAHHPPIDWGNTSASLRSFLAHVSGAVYAGYALGDVATNAWAQSELLLLRLWKQFHPVGLALAVAGMAGMMRSSRYRPLGISLLLSFIAVGAWAAFYRVPDKDVFYSPGTIIISAWCGAGLGYVLMGARSLSLGPGLVRVVGAAGVMVALALSLDLMATNWKLSDRSQQYASLEEAKVALYRLPANAVILVRSDEHYGAYNYYYHVLRHRPVLPVYSYGLMLQSWYQPLRDPLLAEAVFLVIADPPDSRPAHLLTEVRRRTDPSRPLYTDIELKRVPPGYVLLKDRVLYRLVAPPGIPQAADAPGARPLLQLPGGAGSLLGVATPRRLKRGEPFAITAAIRWSGRVPPDGELLIAFIHSTIAQQVAAGKTEGARELVLVRSCPLLFGLASPASRSGWHYQQTFNALFPPHMVPGRYQVFAQLARDKGKTPLAPAGAVSLR